MIQHIERGDIVNLDLAPTKGREQQGTRPALVLTPKYFNNLGLALVAPITNGGKSQEIAGLLPLFATKTTGVVLTNQIRTIHIKARVMYTIETCPKDILIEVLARVQTLVEFE